MHLEAKPMEIQAFPYISRRYIKAMFLVEIDITAVALFSIEVA
jgi:hypothetical protein